MGNTDGTGRGSPALVQSVDRAVSVLELLATHGELGITELAREMEVHKSTVSRLVSVLESRGLVEQLSERGKYAIGFGVVRLAGAVAGRMDLAKLGHPICQELAEELGETVNIAVSDDGAAINVSQERATAAIAAENWIGRRTPLHATSSGKILLTAMSPGQRERILSDPLPSYTPCTITDVDELLATIERAAKDGYAVSLEELEVGLHAVAVPVRGSHGSVIAALSASGPAYRLSRQRLRQIVPTMSAAAGELSAQLGYFAG
ncbi:IclR family transcriptional regulator [Gandjariella thermophila]|uniref:Glycerol operon regulatory protein n=1 Tax=Gandjariella thermophila TaxID=1931992 RepID=A0A4D4J3L6_9PSEU|nr:IclR family transcriptional regulator [Gandjariella thermophila]GDY29672.1 IclR family transcriptional regulator [Gandjariella thermophila]